MATFSCQTIKQKSMRGILHIPYNMTSGVSVGSPSGKMLVFESEGLWIEASDPSTPSEPEEDPLC